jgi:hypothetical protein
MVASSVPSEYGSLVPSDFCTENDFPTNHFYDNTVKGNGFGERIHPALANKPIYVSNEISIHKKDLGGKAKLCFDSIGSNIVRVYIKYQDIGKRKFS